MKYKKHTNCRVCHSDKLTSYLNLGWLPLSNNVTNSAESALNAERYPLEVMLCEECGLSQLSIVIPPEDMFSNYVYRSSISKGYRDHCHQMAVDLQQKYNLNVNSFHVDIAGNDGALLNEFKNFLGHRVLNIDPALNLAPICESSGIPTLTTFWSEETAERVIKYFGQADLITATNVFAHVDRVKEFIHAAKLVLKTNGVLVLEFPYLINFIENNELDVIYFEHLSYFGIHPLDILCENAELEIVHITKHPIHGGSVRVEIKHANPYTKRDHTVSQMIRDEKERYGTYIGRYLLFSQTVKKTICGFRDGIKALKNVAGFAASAKGNVLLNVSGITTEMRYIVDQTPEKIGKFSPGTGIEIVSMERLITDPPDYLVVLSWNFFSEIKEKCRNYGYKGKFIIGIPDFKILY